MPSVLFINRVYPPDEGATGQLLAELAAALAREGWKVTVLTQANSESSPGSQATKHESPITIHRVRGLPFTRASNWKRALSYASLYPALLWRALRLPRHDVVVTLTDPPLVALLGPLICSFKRSRLVHWAQDVYPEVAEEVGVLRKGSFAARVLRSFSTTALKRHDRIIVVGRCMKDRLLQRGLAAEKISMIPNWAVGVTSSAISRLPSSIPHPLTVMYSGNFGLAHPFEPIIEAARILERDGAHIRFVFVGAGSKFAAVREQLAGCNNVEFRNPVPLSQLPQTLASADVHLASMSDALCGLVVPSKVYGVLAARRPCMFLGPRESEAARLLEESQRGIVLQPQGSGPELATRLTRWSKGDVEYQTLRANCERTVSPPGVSVQEFIEMLRD